MRAVGKQWDEQKATAAVGKSGHCWHFISFLRWSFGLLNSWIVIELNQTTSSVHPSPLMWLQQWMYMLPDPSSSEIHWFTRYSQSYVLLFHLSLRTSQLWQGSQRSTSKPVRFTSTCPPKQPCNPEATAPESGRWTLTPESAGRTHWWAGLQRKILLPLLSLMETKLF